MLKILAKNVVVAIVNTSKGKYILKNENIMICPTVAITIPFFVPKCSILTVIKHAIILTGIATIFCIVLLVSLENPALTS